MAGPMQQIDPVIFSCLDSALCLPDFAIVALPVMTFQPISAFLVLPLMLIMLEAGSNIPVRA